MIQYIEMLNLATCRPEGVLEKELDGELLYFLQAMETELPSAFRLVDLAAINEIRLSGMDLYHIAESRRSAAEKLRPCRSAIFAPTVLKHGIAKIYEDLMKGSNIEVGVFPRVKPSRSGLESRNRISASVMEVLCVNLKTPVEKGVWRLSAEKIAAGCSPAVRWAGSWACGAE